ncbi:uncharacterized protein BT62DRAFT_181785 [Guyanagaster necrorhizus]|uniref:Uncharacterized protein n=1 Tax=Guyanagaster necrorhizus TaxID=856835 RepID=A0A9P7VR51_9AGAR|nr:uncharacterized protein BT62DRAFT_181785 [Guyanagaster necrorhizus MCA 3950]KAG7445180.1 hypothetical protein BT62DRAFT_181785 [Guyanagaster necrorhizus MCA 3950]
MPMISSILAFTTSRPLRVFSFPSMTFTSATNSCNVIAYQRPLLLDVYTHFNFRCWYQTHPNTLPSLPMSTSSSVSYHACGTQGWISLDVTKPSDKEVSRKKC